MVRHRIALRVFHAPTLLFAAFCAATLGVQSARATNASSNFTVSATVLASCSVTAGNLSFGSYTASSATPNTASSTVAVTCTNGTTYSVSLDGGTVSNAMTARNMKDTAGDLLSYGLYTTSAYTTVWGDGTGGTGDNSSSGTGTAQSYTVYGQVPAAQYVAPSSYADQISVTVSY